MNDHANEQFQSQEDFSRLNLSIEQISEKDQFSDSHKRQIHDFIRKEFSRKSNNGQFPTVKKMIQVLNSQQMTPRNQQPTKHQQEQTTSNQQLISLYLSQPTRGNRNKKLKDISKLITLKKDVIEKIEKTHKQQEQKSIKQNIESLIDDIYSARSAKAFFSQPHYMKNANNDKKNSHTLRLLNKKKDNNVIESDVKYISVSGSYKTLQSSRTSSQCAYQKRTLSRLQKNMNKLEAQKGYINTIRQLGINKTVEIQKNNLYHTIDPNKTEKWFETAQYSRKKLTQLFKEKQKFSEEKVQKSIKSQKNEYVQKLLQKSSQQYINLANQVKEITKARQKGKSLILIDKHDTDQSRYKVKEKQYYKIQMGKNSTESKKKDQKLEAINYLLPQIKASSKM